MSKTDVRVGRRKHRLTERMKELAAAALAQKVGYLRVEDFPGSVIFSILPKQEYKSNRLIRCEGALRLVSGGTVRIRHARLGYPVKDLSPGALFGEISLLGQTMLGTEAVAAESGALVATMDTKTAGDWIKAQPLAIIGSLGPRLASVTVEHYRSQFHVADSRIAALLLELAGAGSIVEGRSHAELGEMISLYRETVTVVLEVLRQDGLIEIGRRRITLLDKKALQGLSEL
jgi:CRP-like cAMP-binding protein